ncbi:tripartite tricarboxylate transporter TctB family protein [Polaromonas aquatica]|uniref:tripartite tricarboxylate transporter TctB family protein n=1 Tax=Polaromonas aquatica TaxID=332657 RepID=UPI003D64B4A0
MQPNQESGAEVRSGVATYVVEAIVATSIVILGAVVLQGSWALGSGWTSDGPGPGYFPFYIGIILCISGVGTLYQALFGKTRNTDVFVDGEQLKRVLSVLIPAIVYVLAVQFLGLYVASAVYIALFMIVLGKFSPIKSVITSLLVIALFFFMFEVWFKVPLFKGRFEPLSFLGY